jgi:hypothetical protein
MSDSKNATTWQRPVVVKPTATTAKPGTTRSVPRYGDPVEQVRGTLRDSGLDVSALNALSAGYSGEDKQRKNKRSH